MHPVPSLNEHDPRDPWVHIRLSDLTALREAAGLDARLQQLALAIERASAATPVEVPPTPPTIATAYGPLPPYVDTKEAARLLGLTVKGLEAMRARGYGPPFVRVGRRIRYPTHRLHEGTLPPRMRPR